MNKKQAARFVWLSNALGGLGMSDTEINILMRAERTLHRWAELECGDGNDHGSWSIERGEDGSGEGKPFMVHHHYMHGRGKDYTTRTAIADREAGALRRVKEICERHGVTFYHQTDPRGCALYIIRPGDVREGQTVDSCYNNGLAICID